MSEINLASITDHEESIQEEFISKESNQEVLGLEAPLESTTEVAEEEDFSSSDMSKEEPNPEELLQEATRLREEIRRLQADLTKKEEQQAQALKELEEFHTLFPDIPIKDIPSSVWQSVEGGIPISAAYAVYERKLQLERAHADRVNIRNASLSAGMAGKHTVGEYFSPDEVRAMSQRQVHENYEKIRESMKKWN